MHVFLASLLKLTTITDWQNEKRNEKLPSLLHTHLNAKKQLLCVCVCVCVCVCLCVCVWERERKNITIMRVFYGRRRQAQKDVSIEYKVYKCVAFLSLSLSLLKHMYTHFFISFSLSLSLSLFLTPLLLI